MSAHTPGPWTWWTSNSWKRLKHDERGKSSNVLEPFVCKDGHPDLSVTDEDMALIKAAPDMLEVLKAARIVLINRDQSDNEMKLLDAIKYVIAKAEGRLSG